jgi:predicted ester cyclase
MPCTSFVSPDHVKGSYTYKGVLAMSTEHNKELARRATEEGLNRQNPALVDELCAPNFVFHNASRTIQGLQAYKHFLSQFFTAFSDAHFTTEDLIAEGDTVAVRRTFRGTHTGSLLGIPPTGRQVAITDMAILRVANGEFVEAWNNVDELGLLHQLGVITTLFGVVFLAGLATGMGLIVLVRKVLK